MRINGTVASVLVLLLVANRPPIAGKDLQRNAEALALVGVNVITMEREEVLSNQTVVVDHGIITAIGPETTTNVPDGALRIDGRGKYLLPGFIDTFAHVDDESDLILFAANGVTTVRNTAGGYARHLALRDRVASGELLGPRVLTTGGDVSSPPLNYDSMEPVTTGEQAERIVEEVKRMGFDGVMVYSQISPEAHQGVIAAANRLGLPVTGHQSLHISPLQIAQSGQRSVENLIGYVRLATGELGLSDDRVDDIADAFRNYRVFVIPTLTVHRVRGRYRLATPQQERYIPKCARPSLLQPGGRLGPQTTYNYTGAPRLIAMLHKRGVRVLVGTDAGYPGVIPGFSIHGPYGELENLAAAGFSPYEVLSAATKDAADFLGMTVRVGTVSPGKIADLVLLNANPLVDLSNAGRIEAIFLHGRYLRNEELKKQLDTIAARYANTRDRFANLPLPPNPGRPDFTATYQLTTGGCVRGEERVLVYRANGNQRRLVAQSSIDPTQDTKTTLIVEADKNSVTKRVDVIRDSPEGVSELSMLRQGGTVIVKGTRPFYGNISLEEEVGPDTILSGPVFSDEIEFDMAGTFFLVSERVTDLAPGQARELKLKQLELDPDKHLRDATVGDMLWNVARDDAIVGDRACRGCKGYVIRTTGRSGLGAYKFEMVVDAFQHPILIRFGDANDSLQLQRISPRV